MAPHCMARLDLVNCIRVKNWPNVENLGNFNGGKNLFKCFLRVNYLTFCNSA